MSFPPPCLMCLLQVDKFIWTSRGLSHCGVRGEMEKWSIWGLLELMEQAKPSQGTRMMLVVVEPEGNDASTCRAIRDDGCKTVELFATWHQDDWFCGARRLKWLVPCVTTRGGDVCFRCDVYVSRQWSASKGMMPCIVVKQSKWRFPQKLDWHL